MSSDLNGAPSGGGDATPMPAYQAITEVLRTLGVTAVSGLMGDEVAKLIASISSRSDITFYTARHEAAAVAMAHGHARASGELGVCVISRGPGFTNAITALVHCTKARTPVLALIGDTAGHVDPEAGLDPKHVAQHATAEAAGIVSRNMRTAGDLLEGIESAAREAMLGRTVICNLMADLLEVDIPVSTAEDPRTSSPQTPSAVPAGAEPAVVAELATMLENSRRPMVLAGRGAMSSQAREELSQLAASTGGILGTSLLAKDLFLGLPGNIGLVGGFSYDLAREILSEVDCVLAFGASLNAFTTGGGKIFDRAVVAQIALDPGQTGLKTPPDIVVRHDAVEVARAVRARVEAAASSEPASRWPEALLTKLATYDRRTEIDDASGPDGVDTRSLLVALSGTLPQRRKLVLDAGHFTGWAATYVDVARPQDFVPCIDFAAVGLGLGTALGVAAGAPDYVTILIVGDGGLLMSLGDLETAVRYNLPLVIVAVNDAAYGAEMHFLQVMNLEPAEAVFPMQDLAKVASALGMDSIVVASLEDAERAGRAAHRLERPLLIDCRVNRDVRAGWLTEWFTTPEGYGR